MLKERIDKIIEYKNQIELLLENQNDLQKKIIKIEENIFTKEEKDNLKLLTDKYLKTYVKSKNMIDTDFFNSLLFIIHTIYGDGTIGLLEKVDNLEKKINDNKEKFLLEINKIELKFKEYEKIIDRGQFFIKIFSWIFGAIGGFSGILFLIKIIFSVGILQRLK